MNQRWKDKHGLTYAGPGPKDGEQAYQWALRELEGTMKMGTRLLGLKGLNDKLEVCLDRIAIIKKIVAQENEGLQSDLHLLQSELCHAD